MEKKGFTLIELLMVIVIIGILSSIAIPQYRKVMERSYFTKAQVMAKAMHDSCERLIDEWGVESYENLPNNKKNIASLDIGSTDVLPGGFGINEGAKQIFGSGFSYTLSGECVVTITKTSGQYSGVQIKYNGAAFYDCSESAGGLAVGACEVYGLD